MKYEFNQEEYEDIIDEAYLKGYWDGFEHGVFQGKYDLTVGYEDGES